MFNMLFNIITAESFTTDPFSNNFGIEREIKAAAIPIWYYE